MQNFSLSIFFSQIQRVSFEESQKLLETYHDDIKKLPIVEVNQIFNFLENKLDTVKTWKSSKGVSDMLTFKMIAERKPILTPYLFEEIYNLDNLHPTLQIEVANFMEEQERLNIINNFASKLKALTLQTFILELNTENQRKMIEKYKDKLLDADFKTLITFVATLKDDNQIYFCKLIKEYIKTKSVEDQASLVFGIHEKYIEEYFNEYKDIIDNFDKEMFINFLSMLSPNIMNYCCKYFSNKLEELPADLLMYKLSKSITDTSQIYDFWKNTPTKIKELSNTYFNLVISRLDDNSRLASVKDFKSRYNNMDAKELLALFKYDNNSVKYEIFKEYKDKINKIDNNEFMNYINDINDSNIRTNIYSLYKDKINSFNDNELIYFIEQFFEKNLRFVDDSNETNLVRSESLKFIVDNFSERIKRVNTENIPKLFKDSNAALYDNYMDLLKEKIEKLIEDKTYLKSLLTSLWGNTRLEFFSKFEDSFKKLNASDWYSLVEVFRNTGISSIEKFLLNCDIDDLSFVNIEDLMLKYGENRNMYSCFEKNIQNRITIELEDLINKGNVEDILKIYKDKFETINNTNIENILLDANCTQMLTILKVLLKNNIITDKDEYYIKFKDIYFDRLLNSIEIENVDNIKYVKNGLFYRLIKGSIVPINLITIETLKGLILCCKYNITTSKEDLNNFNPENIEYFVNFLNEEQTIKLNNKLFKQICEKLLEKYKDYNPSIYSTRILAIKLFLSVGYKNAMDLLKLDIPFTTYEYIFNDIDLKSINIDEKGEPIINKKLLDFLFGSSIKDENTNIVRLLKNKIPDFDKHFSSIYNGWEVIYQELNGNISVSRILQYFKDNKILLNPDEYRLKSVINEFGTNPTTIEKARNLYNDMRKRKYSTIPKVSGKYNDEYTYEILDLDDPLGLAVGYITRCCFLIDGESYTSLYHSAQSKDGRIFVVRKNGELIAQSWVWRNGNLVCFDNVETRGNFDKNTLLEVYKMASNSILSVSKKEESSKEQIKLITFGGQYSKITKPEESVPYDDIQTPRVKDYIYTDAKYDQYILASNKEKDLYYGDVSIKYKDERKKPTRYIELALLDNEQKSKINNNLNSIIYAKEHKLKTYDLDSYIYGVVSNDWFILISKIGEIECVVLNDDIRAKEEVCNEMMELEKIFKSSNVKGNAKDIKIKVLALIKGDK